MASSRTESQSDRASIATSSSDTSTIPSSQWSQRKKDMYENMSVGEQELFDELQDEIEELRKLLAMRHKEATKKVHLSCLLVNCYQ